MTTAMARGILVVTLLPFLYFAGQDLRLHLSARRVPVAENLVHLAIGVVLAMTIASAFRFDLPLFAAVSALFVSVGAVDEYLFHRQIPRQESEVHAKQHFAILTFLIAAVCVSLARA